MQIKLNGQVTVDLDRLIESRMLVQANSGGGKSWAIRRIIEQAFWKVQIIVIDPEGEFGNLRSKYDFVYAGKGGDAPVESRSAALLAHRLLELKASAIIDLYELPPQERKHFVKLFCESLVNAPKELWHDVLIIIDEAHVFAPEKGESEALGAVIDLASRGRKRGYAAILATQRPAKLSKDASAECNNKLIGRASLDIDRKRAAEELGFSTKEDVLSLRNLQPGEFYAFGPAISQDVQKVVIGDVSVKPAKRGTSKQSVSAPSATVKKMLAKLADLPAEAAQEARTVAELKAEINLLKRQKIDRLEPKSIKIDQESIDRAVAARDTVWKVQIEGAQRELRRLTQLLNKVSSLVGAEQTSMLISAPELPKTSLKAPEVVGVTIPEKGDYNSPPVIADTSAITGPEQRILNAIAWMESIGIKMPEQTAVAFLAGYAYGGGGFNNPKGSLRSKGLVEYVPDNKIMLTSTGRGVAATPADALTTQELHNKVLNQLPGPEQRVLKPLLENDGEAMGGEALAVAAGYAYNSGGFNNPRGRLRSLGLIEYLPGGMVRARSILFI